MGRRQGAGCCLAAFLEHLCALVPPLRLSRCACQWSHTAAINCLTLSVHSSSICVPWCLPFGCHAAPVNGLTLRLSIVSQSACIPRAHVRPGGSPAAANPLTRRLSVLTLLSASCRRTQIARASTSSGTCPSMSVASRPTSGRTANSSSSVPLALLSRCALLRVVVVFSVPVALQSRFALLLGVAPRNRCALLCMACPSARRRCFLRACAAPERMCPSARRHCNLRAVAAPKQTRLAVHDAPFR